jgi:hypothetical protein
MMNLQEAKAELESRGFFVYERSWVLGDPTLMIARLAERSVIHENDSITAFEELCYIYFKDNHWGFFRVTGAGGFLPDDIIKDTATLDEAMAILREYYFGVPIVIDGWIVKKHKHPEWAEDKLREAVKKAKTITKTEWDDLHYDFRSLIDNEYHGKFNPIAHSENPTIALQLRRDLGDAYIVTGSMGVFSNWI